MKDHKPRSKLVLTKVTNESTRIVDEAGPSSRGDETNTSGHSHPSQSLRIPRRNGWAMGGLYHNLTVTWV